MKLSTQQTFFANINLSSKFFLALFLATSILFSSCTYSHNTAQQNSATPISESSKRQMADKNDEQANSERYAELEENPFVETARAPLSTFSIDVDTASYSNVRRFLNDGQLPPKDAVRVEEFVNYFSYDYPQPVGNLPFSVTTEVSECPWNAKNRLVLIGLQGKRVSLDNVPPSNLVFLLDVSGSMNDERKLPLLKSSLRLLVEQLTVKDRIAIVVYAGSSGLVLPSTTADRKQDILSALGQLEAGGSTNGGAGITLAYKVAQENFIQNGNNRVILATDGDFNVGLTSDDELVRVIEEKRKSGIFLSVLGFGTGNINDSMMEKIADKGNGNYAYIDSMEEARKALGQQVAGTLYTIAKDVKIQVEFNPAQAAGYRLIGYENRLLKDRDFNDDKKDAGEIGAGISVTALYEVVPFGQKVENPGVDPLKYPPATEGAEMKGSKELMTVKLRYKEPNQDESKLLTIGVTDNKNNLDSASENLRFASSVVAFGMLLRNSRYKGQANYDVISKYSGAALGSDLQGHRKEFLSLVDKAKALSQTQKTSD